MASAALLLTAPISFAPAARPDVVFILADDLGYNELNFQNSSRGISTPNLDALAASGVALKNYYVAPICSPTRSALMTGRYMVRLGTQSNVIYWDTPWGVALNETFIAQHFQRAGYATALFGKWHLGMYRKEYTPSFRGFDEHVGYLQGCGSAYTHVAACCKPGSPDNDTNFVCKADPSKDYRGYDWFRAKQNEEVVADPSANGTNSAALVRDAAVDFIKRQAAADRSFFLYLPFQNVHNPYTCDPSYRAPYEQQPSRFTQAEMTMFGYISELDDAVGVVVRQLHASGRYARTLVVFSSDNGAPPAGNDVDHPTPGDPAHIARNHPFRGWKGQIWEGGTRVAGFVSGGTALLPAAVRGTTSHKLYHVTDWLPTLAAAAGVSSAPDAPSLALDGHNVWASLVDAETPSPRTELLYNVNPLCHGGQAAPPKAAIRVGRFKLLAWCFSVAGIGGANTTGPVAAQPGDEHYDPAFAKDRGLALYDLDADAAETTNLVPAKAHAATVETLLARLQALAIQMVEPQQWAPPYQGAGYECADCPLHPAGKGPAVPWGPWL